jgi:excisionase family DNA binding protein
MASPRSANRDFALTPPISAIKIVILKEPSEFNRGGFSMKRVNKLPSAQRRAFKVDAFCDTYGPSRSAIYKLIRKGKIRTVKIGGTRLIPASEGERLLTEGAE